MLLTQATDIPIGKNWLYETKYDGFRCVLFWKKKNLLLKSRTGKLLNQQFPEIIRFCEEIFDQVKSFLPLTLDGEIVFLRNNYQSEFQVVQKRGRMCTSDVIM